MNEMRAALENGGKGKKREKEAEGLLDKMAKYCEPPKPEPMKLLILWDREEDGRVSNDTYHLKGYVEELLAKENKKITFNKAGETIFVHKKSEKGSIEVGLIRQIDVV